MRIVGDILLFLATSLVLSVTILCSIIQLQSHDRDLRSFLYILVPLTLQLGIVTFSSYLTRILPESALDGQLYRSLMLLLAIASIVLISLILYSVSLYIMRIGREFFFARFRGIGTWILAPLTILFAVASLFTVLLVTYGDLAEAVSITLKYYSSWGILLLVPHVIAAGVLLPRVPDREIQNHLRGIIWAFAPIAIVFPLDVIFFRDHFFKLAYLGFAAFSVVVYWHISKRFVREYLISPQNGEDGARSLKRFGLSPREEETARLLLKGRTNTEIGRELYISENTVRSHIKSIYRKADVSNRVQLIHKARLGDSAD